MIWLESRDGGGEELVRPTIMDNIYGVGEGVVGPIPVGFEYLRQPITQPPVYPWPIPPLPSDGYTLISGTVDNVYNPWPMDDGPDSFYRLTSGSEDLGFKFDIDS